MCVVYFIYAVSTTNTPTPEVSVQTEIEATIIGKFLFVCGSYSHSTMDIPSLCSQCDRDFGDGAGGGAGAGGGEEEQAAQKKETTTQYVYHS